MAFDFLEYYKALNGESLEDNGVWHVNHGKRHAHRISSDFDAFIDPSNNQKISLPPTEAETELINFFSDKLGQKFKNTKITDNGDGTESIDLELEDRIVTIILDQSGSMTWNDNDNFRHDVAVDLINKIELNYPGDITYNLIEYGADIINSLFFGIVEADGFDPNDIDSLSSMIKADDKANYDAMRIIRNDDHFPTSILDGDLIDDGFISRIKEEGLVEGQTYYYTVYTYNNTFKFSQGTRIKVTPRERVIPRSHSNFRTVVESDDLTRGIPFIGTGVNRDDNTIGIWHMDEGQGQFLYDFSSTGAILSYNKEDPIWYADRFVPSGASGLFFDGDNDYASVDGVSDYNITFSQGIAVTFMAWIYPYDNDAMTIASISNGERCSHRIYVENGELIWEVDVGINFIKQSTTTTPIELYKWQHICVTYPSPDYKFYVNGIEQSFGFDGIVSNGATDGNHHFSIGSSLRSSGSTDYFRGKITEASLHNVVRDSDYINAQLIESPILDGEGFQVGTELIGIRDDNGDRLVVLKYNVPRDYNYVGGEVLVVRKEKKFDKNDENPDDYTNSEKKYPPSWEEDGTAIYEVSDPGSGEFFISDPLDFALEETYYYRLFTKNALGNYSFLSDSPVLEVEIPAASTDDFFLPLHPTFTPPSDDSIPPPEEPTIGQLITEGNEKTYLRWKQNDILDSRISRVKIYYSSSNFPVVNANGGASGTLIFTGLTTDTKYVHRNIRNDRNAFYTIVNVDKYGRPSNYDSDGDFKAEFLQASVVPSATASEATFPLIEVENINYELVDGNTVSIGWDQPKKSAEDIETFFDQTVYIYGSITDEFGSSVSQDTPIRMSVTSSINRESQADDVFGVGNITEFEDSDAYDFFVTRTNEGFFKGILRMTTDSNIISQIKEATFTIQMKAVISKEGGYIPPNTGTSGGGAISQYASLIEQLIEEIDGSGASNIESTDNFYEYFTKTIKVHYTNPWEVELVSRDNQTVPQRCYCEKTDKLTFVKSLSVVTLAYNGVYMRATNPFVARAKVKYKGNPIESGNIQVAVWDAESDNPCSGACGDTPSLNEGDKIAPSTTVLSPEPVLPIIEGQEETYPGSGVFQNISFVDIPIYAPENPQAVRLFVKGEQSGYSSVKDIYILFQSILEINLDADAPRVDGKDISEQQANVMVLNPDYPNWRTSEFDRSLVTYPIDFTVVEWAMIFIQVLPDEKGNLPNESGVGGIYSTDSVPLTNGVFSYTRSGQARNVFLGPIPRREERIDEQHEIKATVVYQGLTAFARQFIGFSYDPNEFDSTSARFLMEIDGGWKGELPNQTWGGVGFWQAENTPLWTDGIHYKKLKISRNPRTAEQTGVRGEGFSYADCFRSCASQDDNELLELSSGQIVEVGFNLVSDNQFFPAFATQDEDVEILHGEIYEVEDPYTGLHTLVVGEEGFVDKGTAFVELNDETVSDTTFFYIRVNRFVPQAMKINTNCFPENPIINDCLCLGSIRCSDVPGWTPLSYVSGRTTVFLNNNPLVLTGGGGMSNGIPPCPIGFNEPLKIYTELRKVIDLVFDPILGEEPDFLVPVETIADSNNFLDNDLETLIKHTSTVEITLRIQWRGQNVPNGTEVFISVGNNNSSTLFVASQPVYETFIDGTTGDSIVIVQLNARGFVDDTRTETVEVFCDYDEAEKTERRASQFFSLTLSHKDKVVPPEKPPTPSQPSVEAPPEEPPPTPYSSGVDRYSISKNEWDQVAIMGTPRGNGFSGTVGDNIYFMGGLLNNSLNVSKLNEKYSIPDDVWVTDAQMSKPRFAGMSVTIGNEIYAIGGIFPDDQKGGELTVSLLVEVYNTISGTWQDKASLPTISPGSAFEDPLGVAFGTATHVELFTSAGLKNYIYVMSGVKEITANNSGFFIEEYNQRVLRYCVEEDSWEWSGILFSNELLTYERLSPLSLVHDDKVIVFSGAIESGSDFIYPSEDFYVDIAEDFNFVPGKSINLGSGFMGGFPVPKFQTAMAKYDAHPSTDICDYYLFGGFNDDSPSLNIVEKISVVNKSLEYQSSYDTDNPSFVLAPMPTGKHGASAEVSIVNGEYVYVMGGYTINKGDDYVSISFGL